MSDEQAKMLLVGGCSWILSSAMLLSGFLRIGMGFAGLGIIFFTMYLADGETA